MKLKVIYLKQYITKRLLYLKGYGNIPSARIHEAIAKELNVDKKFDELLL